MRNDACDILWSGFFGLDASSVMEPPSGGIVVFGRNLDPDPVGGPERCHAMILELQARHSFQRPLAVAIDQEGGTVSRLKIWTGKTPTLRRIWENEGAEGCRAWGRRWGQGCRLLGINVDFAPVADLWDGMEGTGMGDRCASSNPLDVAQAVGAFLTGLEGEGVRGCLKHFPGLGGTAVDSHKALPSLQDRAMVERNLRPFSFLAHPDRLIMVAHVQTPDTGELPASLFRGYVDDNPWGITGRWIPDDMEMGGCSLWGWSDRVRMALDAGHHALLVCQTREGIGACREALNSMPDSLWKPAREKFLEFRSRLACPLEGPFDRAGWAIWLEELQKAAS